MSKTYRVPDKISALNNMKDKLELLKNIKRSFNIFRVDCGSCNGCEIEIFASITPMWDPERFGFKLVASPRHADILLCTGPLTRQMYYPLLRAYEAAPDPKVVVAYGACGSTGGIFYDSYGVWGGIDKAIPVDVWIPGCPPHPASTIYGLATALGILEQRLKHIVHKNGLDEAPKLEDSILGNILFERDIMTKSKDLMGYLHARVLSKKYLDALKKSDNPFDPKLSKIAVENVIREEKDKRYAECMAILHNEVYLNHIARFRKVLAEDKITI